MITSTVQPTLVTQNEHIFKTWYDNKVVLKTVLLS